MERALNRELGILGLSAISSTKRPCDLGQDTSFTRLQCYHLLMKCTCECWEWREVGLDAPQDSFLLVKMFLGSMSP